MPNLKTPRIQDHLGLMKVPDKALLKRALVENGQLKSYIDELEEKIRNNEMVINELRQENETLKQKQVICKYTINDEEFVVPVTREDWRKITIETRAQENVRVHKLEADRYKKMYRELMDRWKEFLAKHAIEV